MSITLLPAVQAFLQRDHGLFIDGRAQAAGSGRQLEVIGPASGEVISRVGEAS
ncbi:MAG TPA: NAD-dependent phenylacetaldehyde dehydrogenase, partial [Pseudomonas sp.]|nr:NAD-dependent phenylacetaldehyde dehydrogenase [Pseudomonas sp.]